jgi:exosortase H (IPTLxxWG-CTERM-specific)
MAAFDGRHILRRGEPRRGRGKREFLAGNWPILRGVILFLALLGGFYGLESMPFARGTIRTSILEHIAKVSSVALDALGYQTHVSGKVITSPNYSVEIISGCDAIDPTAAYIAGVLATPVAFRRKIPGILIGTAALHLINIVRIVTLFYIGIHFPSAFEIVHFDIWQAAFVALTIGLWVLWMQWAMRNTEQPSHVAT